MQVHRLGQCIRLAFFFDFSFGEVEEVDVIMLNKVKELFGVDRKALVIVGAGQDEAAHVNEEGMSERPFSTVKNLLNTFILFKLLLGAYYQHLHRKDAASRLVKN